MKYGELIHPHLGFLEANLAPLLEDGWWKCPKSVYDAEIPDGFMCEPMVAPQIFVPTKDGKTAIVCQSKMLTDDMSDAAVRAAITRQFDLAHRVGYMTFRPYWHAYLQCDRDRHILWTRNAWSK